jgi:hypothetical protein
VGVIVEFNEAAFRHNISKGDILNVLNTKVHDVAIEGLSEKYAAIGFDRSGNSIEVFYNQIDDKSINVFHAMKLRNSTIKILGL